MWLQLEDNVVDAIAEELLRAGRVDLVNALKSRQRAAANEKRMADAYTRAAENQFHREGDLEFDESAVVALSDDGGAYVMAWKWIERASLGRAAIGAESAIA